MAAKHVSDDEYTEGFQWQPEMEMDGSAEEVAAAIAKDLESKYTAEDLKALVTKMRRNNKD